MSTRKTAEDINPVEKMQQELNSLRKGTTTHDPIERIRRIERIQSTIDKYRAAGERDALIILRSPIMSSAYNIRPVVSNNRIKKLQDGLYRFYDTMNEDTRKKYFETTDPQIIWEVLRAHVDAGKQPHEDLNREDILYRFYVEKLTEMTKPNDKDSTIEVDLPYPTSAELKEEIDRKMNSTQYEYVNHPTHYNNYSMEVIDMMLKIWGPENTATFCEMNAYKYRMRLGLKPENPMDQDLKKEKWYLDKAKSIRKEYNLPDPPTKELF